MLRACVFDLGGTIVDKYSLSPFRCMKEVFKNHGVRINNDLLYSDMGMSKYHHISNIVNDKYVNRNLLLNNSHLRPLSTEKITDLFYDQFNILQIEKAYDIEILPETRVAINHLRDRNIYVGVTTGFNKETTQIIINKLNSNNIYIDEFVSSTCLVDKPSRPHPYMIQELMSRFNIVNPREVVKIDDTVIGLKEAYNAHCWSIACLRWSINMKLTEDIMMSEKSTKLKMIECRKILQAAYPDYIINDLNHLSNVIEWIDASYNIYNNYDIV